MHKFVVILQLPLVVVASAVFYAACCVEAAFHVASRCCAGEAVAGLFWRRVWKRTKNLEMFGLANTYDYLWLPFWRWRGGGRRVLYVHYERPDDKQTTLPEQPEDCVRFVFISDTHNKHDHVIVPPGDVLVHTGDILMMNSRLSLLGPSYDLRRFSGWVRRQPHKHKIVMGGNHDGKLMEMGKEACEALFAGATYLENSAVVVEGFKVWGCPWSPQSGSPNRGFVTSDADAALLMKEIPTDVHVLLTHATDGANCVHHCRRRVDPLLHAGGHFHGQHGIEPGAGSQLILCASICDTFYKPIQPPIVVDVPRRLGTANA